MDRIEVDGESTSPEDINEEAWWLTSHQRRSARALAMLCLTLGDSPGQATAGSQSSNKTSLVNTKSHWSQRLPHQPLLPSEDIKIILRPLEGLDIGRISQASVRDGVLPATGISHDEAADDILRTNAVKTSLSPALQAWHGPKSTRPYKSSTLKTRHTKSVLTRRRRRTPSMGLSPTSRNITVPKTSRAASRTRKTLRFCRRDA